MTGRLYHSVTCTEWRCAPPLAGFVPVRRRGEIVDMTPYTLPGCPIGDPRIPGGRPAPVLDPREVRRPCLPPDSSAPGDDTMTPVARPLAVGDRAAWVRPGIGRCGREVEHLGEVAAIEAPYDVWLYLDEDSASDRELGPVAAPIGEVYPRPGR